MAKRFVTAEDAEAWLSSDELGLAVFQRIAQVVDECGGAQLRMSVTQLGWARERPFAYLWSPQRWVGGQGEEVVLALDLPSRDQSPRWQQIVEVRPGQYTHHLEVRSADEVDQEIADRLREAYHAAG